MKLKLELAAAADAGELGELRAAVNRHFLAQFGKGYWISNTTERCVLFRMKRGTVFAAREGPKIVASLTLSTRKPWAIDTRYFTAVRRHPPGCVRRDGRRRRVLSQVRLP